MGIVRKKLLGILGKTIAAISERRIIVMCAYPRIKADPLNHRPCVQPLHFSICIQFIEIRDTEGKICVGEEFDRLSLSRIHKKDRDILLYGSFSNYFSEPAGSLIQFRI